MAARYFFIGDQLPKVVQQGTCFLGPVQYDRTFLGPVQYVGSFHGKHSKLLNMGNYYIPKKLSRSLCIAEKIECFSIFNSLECFPWKLLSYYTGPRNVLSYCTGPRKGVPGGTTFARWSPLKNYLAAILLYTLTEQIAILENLQNASHNKYTRLHLKQIPVILNKKIQLWHSNFPTFS